MFLKEGLTQMVFSQLIQPHSSKIGTKQVYNVHHTMNLDLEVCIQTHDMCKGHTITNNRRIGIKTLHLSGIIATCMSEMDSIIVITLCSPMQVTGNLTIQKTNQPTDGEGPIQLGGQTNATSITYLRQLQYAYLYG